MHKRREIVRYAINFSVKRILIPREAKLPGDSLVFAERLLVFARGFGFLEGVGVAHHVLALVLDVRGAVGVRVLEAEAEDVAEPRGRSLWCARFD
jgi:hypothetical protein